MSSFSTVFPQFIEACAKLHNAFVPYALVILVLSFAFEFWHGATDLPGMFRFLAKLFFIVLLTAQARELINSGQLVIDGFLDQSGLIRPEKLSTEYKLRMAVAFGDPSIKGKSTIRLLLTGKLLDALLYAILVVFAYITLAVVTFIMWVQKMSLLICWGCCPVLFALTAIRPVSNLGTAHISRIMAIVCWPLGFAVASTFSTGLLKKALDDRLLAHGIAASLGAALESMLIVAVVGIWAIISTIAAPAFIHRFLVGRSGVAGMISLAGFGATGLLASTLVPKAALALGGARQLIGGLFGRNNSRSNDDPPPPPPPPLLLPPPPPPCPPSSTSFPPPPIIPPGPAIPLGPTIPAGPQIPAAPMIPAGSTLPPGSEGGVPPQIPPPPKLPPCSGTLPASDVPPAPTLPPPPTIPPASPLPPASKVPPAFSLVSSTDPTGSKRLEELLSRR